MFLVDLILRPVKNVIEYAWWLGFYNGALAGAAVAFLLCFLIYLAWRPK